MRTIGVVTVARSDYGILLPVLRGIQADESLKLTVYAGGMHMAPEFGLTVKTIEADGFEIAARVEMLLASDSAEGIAKSVGLGVMGFAQAYANRRPDMLLVVGDRFEFMAAVLAALPFKIPVAHIHGGEISEGAIDDALRHSITKLSHLHFVSTEEYGRRVAQLGEEPWRITVTGAPSLDNLHHVRRLTNAELSAKVGLPMDTPPLLVTYHPVTLEYEQTEWQTRELLAALDAQPLPIVFTLPNADTNGRIIIRLLKEFVRTRPQTSLVENLGTEAYFSLMSVAAAMVGNSSSGLLEAPTFKLPVVNVGNRQRGRIRAENVIDVGYTRAEIAAGIQKATSPEFRSGLRDLVNPYGQGNATGKIVDALKRAELNDRLLQKRFNNLLNGNLTEVVS